LQKEKLLIRKASSY